MHLEDALTDEAVLRELGRRLARSRLQQNRTQAETAAEAGIGVATLQRIERGRSVQMTSLVRLMRVLGLLEALDAALPESQQLPIAELERERRGGRRRARGSRGRSAERPAERPWRWGEQERRER